MAYRTSRRTSCFRRRPSRRYSRRPFAEHLSGLDLLVVDVSLSTIGNFKVGLPWTSSYLPGLSGSHGKVFLLRLPVCSQHLLVFQLVFLARAWVLSLRLSSLQAAAPRRQGHLQDHLALPLKTSPLVFNANWDRHCCSQQASGFSESTANVTWALSVTYQISGP